jgi:hypothetical protein
MNLTLGLQAVKYFDESNLVSFSDPRIEISAVSAVEVVVVLKLIKYGHIN